LFGSAVIQHRGLLHEAFRRIDTRLRFFLAGAGFEAVANMVVLGREAITTFSLDGLFLKEGSSLPKVAGMALILVGIVALRIKS